MRISDWSSDVCSSDLPTPPERGDSRNSQPSEIADLPQAKVTRMSPCYVRHHLSLNRRLQPAVRQGQFLHSSQTSAGHRRRKIGRYSFAIVGSSQAFHDYQKRPAYEPHGICDRFPTSTPARHRSEEHTSELQSLMRISYAVFCLKKKKIKTTRKHRHTNKQQIKTTLQQIQRKTKV